MPFASFVPNALMQRNPPDEPITLRSQRQFLAQQAAREREKTADFKKRYSRRASVEGTISQGVRAFDLRRTRYIGLVKHTCNIY